MNKKLYALSMDYFTEYYNQFINIENEDCIFTYMTYILSYNYYHDRFGILDKYSKYNWNTKSKIPKFKCDITDIEEICNIVAEQYYRLTINGNKIVIFWSGGVDSTCCLVSFLKLHNLDLNNITVMLSNESIKENEYFYNNFIKGKLNTIFFNTMSYIDKIKEISNNNYIFISAQCGDQLFGSAVHKKSVYNKYNSIWYEVLKQIYIDFFKIKTITNINYGKINIEKLYDKHMHIYVDYFRQLNLNIKYFCEFAWLLNFAFKWDFIKYDQTMVSLNSIFNNKYYCFYDDILFQEWSIHNFNNIKNNNIYNNPINYKKEFKDIIYRFDNNAEYLKNKTKEGSHVTYNYKNNYLANLLILYDEDGIKHYNINSNKLKILEYDQIYNTLKYLRSYRK